LIASTSVISRLPTAAAAALPAAFSALLDPDSASPVRVLTL
jgi:hypothetical protein